jgi:two-component system, sensor histidine kinase and response regulator
MDVQMPEMDGLEVTSKIRKLDEPKRNVPIIAITAHALIGDREKCIRAGMNEYISKPIRSTELLALIDKLLKVNSISEDEKEITVNDKKVNETNNLALDFKRLKKVSLGDKDFEKDLLKDYMVDTRSKYEQMTDVLKEKNFKKLSELAHTLKGSSYTVGASVVGDESLGIEFISQK